eukprot:3808605-Alexandrium_andersonii.AAC.1
MSASLVGSEMCIRDRAPVQTPPGGSPWIQRFSGSGESPARSQGGLSRGPGWRASTSTESARGCSPCIPTI